jgi:hypothetical protein
LETISLPCQNRPNKALQLTPSRDAPVSHDRSVLSIHPPSELCAVSGQLSLAFGHFMNSFRHAPIWISLSLFMFASCGGRPGDGEEAGSDKQEWSILQVLEVQHRGESIEKIEFQKFNEYQIICIPRYDNHSRIWIIADPKSPPFYKQLPSGNYWLTKEELDEVRTKADPISTVLSALRSHLK